MTDFGNHKNGDSCGRCIYWHKTSHSPEEWNEPARGECRIRSMPMHDFPWRTSDEWCGEFVWAEGEAEKFAAEAAK